MKHEYELFYFGIGSGAIDEKLPVFVCFQNSLGSKFLRREFCKKPTLFSLEPDDYLILCLIVKCNCISCASTG